jgi:predicted membrane channel-forming protein YqfA (hemolysin III family)|tara:strand:- start:477 stop:905 length:429 start_codon:yes stop_codon:yes gene_type:complete
VENGDLVVRFRKICIFLLFAWLCLAIVVNVFGFKLFFPLQIGISPEEEFYRLNAMRFGASCLLALILVRYLLEFRPLPSLVAFFWFGTFFIIGGIIYAIKLDIEIDQLYYLVAVAVVLILIRLEIMQKKRESESSLYKRDHF